MSVASQINRIKGNISAAYTAITGKGGTEPATKNSANLATAIASIPSGGGGYWPEVNASEYYEQNLMHFHDCWENGGEGIHIENASVICDLVGQNDMTVGSKGICNGNYITKIVQGSNLKAALADNTSLDFTGNKSAEITIFGAFTASFDIFVHFSEIGCIGYHGNGTQFVFNSFGSCRWNCSNSITTKGIHTITANYTDGSCVSAFVDGAECEISSTGTSFGGADGYSILPYNVFCNCSSFRVYDGHRTLVQHNANHALDLERWS